MRTSTREDIKHLLLVTANHMGMRCSHLGGKTHLRNPDKGQHRLQKRSLPLYVYTILIARNK